MNTVYLVEITNPDTNLTWSQILHMDTDLAEFLTQEFTYDEAIVAEITKKNQSVRRFTITTREGIYTAEVFEMPVEMPRVGAA